MTIDVKNLAYSAALGIVAGGGVGMGVGVGGVGTGIGGGGKVGGGTGIGSGIGCGGAGGGVGTGCSPAYVSISVRSTSVSISSNASRVIGPTIPSSSTFSIICSPRMPKLDDSNIAFFILSLSLPRHAFDNLSNMSANSV